MTEDEKYLFDLNGYLVVGDLTPEQRAVLEPPYHTRLDRPMLTDEGLLPKPSGD